MLNRKIIIYIFLILISCNSNNKQNSKTVEVEKPKTITIYCESVLQEPLREIIKGFEKEIGCKINLYSDCSQNLVSLILYNGNGDLFIPASTYGFKLLNNKNKSLLIDSTLIGYNYISIMTRKDNLKNVITSVNSLTDRSFAIKMANPNLSSLGYETKKMLESFHIYNDVLGNVISFSADSKGMINDLLEGETNVIINWSSALYNYPNKSEINSFQVNRYKDYDHKIYAGLLKTSKNKPLVNKFLNYVCSDKGKEVFNNHGIIQRRGVVF